MFLICFGKVKHAKEVTRVYSTRLAKGKNMIVTTVGNKGGLQYSFMLYNHTFNVIGSHLQHKREKQERRNYMSRELINEMKTAPIQARVNGLESD